MHALIASALALPAFAGPAAPNISEPQQPYRVVTSVVIVPDVDTRLTDFFIECHDGAGTEELWELQSFLGTLDQAASMSLRIDSSFQFSIETTYAPFSISVTNAIGDSVTVDALKYQTDTDYLAFIVATEAQRGFVIDLMQEYKIDGTMQGVIPTLILPDADDGGGAPPDSDGAFGLGGQFFAPVAAIASPSPAAVQANNRAKCIADVTLVLGPKPADCEGAIDEYRCCMWEMYVDACTRQRDCDALAWYLRIPCMGAAVVANGVDTTACICGLPVPGA